MLARQVVAAVAEEVAVAAAAAVVEVEEAAAAVAAGAELAALGPGGEGWGPDEQTSRLPTARGSALRPQPW